MRTRKAGPLALAFAIGLAFTSCGGPEKKVVAPDRDEIPPDQLASVMDAHYRGLGAMERYEYAQAAEAFREVHQKAPGWIPGSINLAIALLNLGGEEAEKAKQQGSDGLDGAPKKNIDEADRLLTEVIARRPRNASALFSRGSSSSSRPCSKRPRPTFARSPRSIPSTPTPGSNSARL